MFSVWQSGKSSCYSPIPTKGKFISYFGKLIGKLIENLNTSKLFMQSVFLIELMMKIFYNFSEYKEITIKNESVEKQKKIGQKCNETFASMFENI